MDTMKRFFTSRNFELQTRLPTPPGTDKKQNPVKGDQKVKAPAKKDKAGSKMGTKGVTEVQSNSSLGSASAFVDPQNFVCVEDIEKDD